MPKVMNCFSQVKLTRMVGPVDIRTTPPEFKGTVRKGDLNGDGTVSIADITIWGLAFGSYPGHPRWNQRADINSDGRVDIVDAMLITREWIS